MHLSWRTVNPAKSNPKDSIMHTIVLATQKGGSGKSTLAIGLALAAIQAGHTVRLIETDSQGTLSNWQSRRIYAEPIVEPVYVAGEIEQRLQSLSASGVTLAIVDTAGGISAATTAAIRYADLCLIPARPSVADIEATASTLAFDPRQTTRRSPSCSTRRRSAASASTTRRRRFATRRRSISPVFSPSPSSSCATITRMR